MKWLAYVLAGLLGALGLVFVAGNQGVVLRLVVGVILMAAAVVLVVVVRLRPEVRQVVQKVELGGDTRLEALSCRSCGAKLDRKSVTVQAGAVFVACPYCDAAYQLEEAPKW